MQSHLVQRDRCPRCASLGADTQKDNLALYSDGHKYCFGCGYHVPGTLRSRLESTQIDAPVTTALNFPDDYTLYIPQNIAVWLLKRGFTQEETQRHRIGWSAQRQMLIIPVYGADNQLIMWQGRDFSGNPSNKKYFTAGPASDILHIIRGGLCADDERDIIICTEGVLDAIKVSRIFNAMPLWGSNMPLKTIRRLAGRFSRLGIWLDSDKFREAVKTALRASQFIPSFVVSSFNDPKDILSHEMIRRHVEDAGWSFQYEPDKTIDTDART